MSVFKKPTLFTFGLLLSLSGVDSANAATVKVELPVYVNLPELRYVFVRGEYEIKEGVLARAIRSTPSVRRECIPNGSAQGPLPDRCETLLGTEFEFGPLPVVFKQKLSLQLKDGTVLKEFGKSEIKVDLNNNFVPYIPQVKDRPFVPERDKNLSIVFGASISSFGGKIALPGGGILDFNSQGGNGSIRFVLNLKEDGTLRFKQSTRASVGSSYSVIDEYGTTISNTNPRPSVAFEVKELLK